MRVSSTPTGIAELDRLLGIGKGAFPSGATILIRGGPGAGKTTLALQILDRQLRCEHCKMDQLGLFISFEQPASDAFLLGRKHFGQDSLPEPYKGKQWHAGKEWPSGTVVGIGPDKLNRLLREYLREEGSQGSNEFRARNKKTAPKPGFIPNAVAQAMIFGCEGLVDFVPKNHDMKRLWVVVDSVNVLERLLREETGEKRNRTALQGIHWALGRELHRIGFDFEVVTLFTSEHRWDIGVAESAAEESFFCDVVIQLAPEPIVGTSHLPPRQIPHGGYSIELHHRLLELADQPTHTVVVETRPFCRILKCRFGKNQSRRCSYEIVSGRGVQFNELFPGDGQLLLFAENEKQREDWKQFLLKDAPFEFPCLRFELFDRTGLQRVFATQRRFQTNLPGTDLNLASFDTYWIKWYQELYHRAIIGENLSPLREKFKKARKEGDFCRLVCEIDRNLPLGRPKIRALAEKVNQQCLQAGLQVETKDLEQLLKGLNERLRTDLGLFHPISFERLRLFGERASKLIPELKCLKYIELKRDSSHNKERLLSVPYNANVSLLVYRKDLLAKLTTRDRQRIARRMKELYYQQECDLQAFCQNYWNKLAEFGVETIDSKEQQLTSSFSIKRGELEKTCKSLAEAVGPDNPPRTWEEIIAISEVKDWNYLIETQTFDSFLCTFLELLWGCGGHLRVDHRYRLRKAQANGVAVFHALLLLQTMLKSGVIPAHSTLEASAFGARFSASADGRPKGGRDWAFARHWYSTLVDVLTAKKGGIHLWQPGSVDIEVASLPCSLRHFLQTPAPEREALGVSCWGEWHLTVLRGTENEALAVELINNLMSSQKVTERALRCAALPTVRDFYLIYPDSPCLSLPERADLSLPKMTYGELRRQIFAKARSRADLFDYRHCMRELHGLLEHLLNTPDTPSATFEKELISTLTRIKRFEQRELLLH